MATSEVENGDLVTIAYGKDDCVMSHEGNGKCNKTYWNNGKEILRAAVYNEKVVVIMFLCAHAKNVDKEVILWELHIRTLS